MNYLFVIAMVLCSLSASAGVTAPWERAAERGETLETTEASPMSVTDDSLTVSDAPKLVVTQVDSIKTAKKEAWATSGIYRFRPLQLIVPAAMIGVGVIGLESHWIISGNHEVREELQEGGHGQFTIDDFTQFAPAVAVYGLNLCGVKGVHDFGERTIILGTATLLTLTAVYTIKATGNVERPDGSARNSFPSGHTAVAFMGAEFLRREYRNVSPWIGVAGYAVAAGTGFLRMYNNRHWATDVLAGAGIGILSTEISYWVYPYLSRVFYPGRRRHPDIALLPVISPDSKGLACSITF